MAKEGVFGNAEKGYDVYVSGKLTGWFRSKKKAREAYLGAKVEKGYQKGVGIKKPK